MKSYLRWTCSALFLAAVIAVICFLHLFIKVEDSIKNISWDSSVQILEDGTEQPFSWEGYSNDSDPSGTYRFTGKIPEGLSSGSLVFETTGLDLTLSLNGREIWKSQMERSENNGYPMAQATIPLAQGTSGELSVTCTILDESVSIFPPMIRFVPDFLQTIELTAMANREAFPAGAAALALLLIFGIFLLGILLKQTDWSLIPLLFSTGGLAFYNLIQSQGYYFLPENIYLFLSRREIGLLIILTFLVYLAMNRRRRFWKYLGIAALWSGAAFLLCYLISLAMGGSFSYTVNDLLVQLIQSGYYENIVYWLTRWLALVCAFISAYNIFRSFMDQKIQAQGLLLKNRMVTENYRTLESRMEETSARQHEINHQLTALECLCRNRDYKGLEKTLSQIQAEQHARTIVVYTGNRTVNTILQDAAGRAAKMNISFQPFINIPDTLNIPDTDLCTLLMNMLDNALEAALKVTPPDQRFLKIHIKVQDPYLAVKCENTFDGKLLEDKKGNLLTTKENPKFHGFGFRQMQEIAGKYHSVIRFDTLNDYVFTVQTALRIPDK